MLLPGPWATWVLLHNLRWETLTWPLVLDSDSFLALVLGPALPVPPAGVLAAVAGVTVAVEVILAVSLCRLVTIWMPLPHHHAHR